MSKAALTILLLAGPLFATPVDPDGEPALEHRVLHGDVTLDRLVEALPDYNRTDVDPGMPPEGDYIGFMTWTRDGSKLLLTNRVTNNLTVFDGATMAIDTVVPTGYSPGGIAVTDSLCVVTLGFADSVEVYRLSDWTRVAEFPSGEQPWVVHISPDDSLAFVSCDIDNTCEVYDLVSLQHVATIEDFPIFLSSFSWNSENGRSSFQFSDFGVHPDGDRLLVPNGEDTLYVFDISSGEPVDTITGLGDCRHVRFSGDNRFAVIVDGDNPMTVNRIRLDSMLVDSTVSLPAGIGMARDCAVNQDGSKAFVSVSGNQSALVRFATADYVTYSQTYSAFWIGVSADHSLAVSGQYRFSIIDFATEQMVGQHQGNSQSMGAVSPVDNRAGGVDPHRHEGVYFYTFSDSAAPSYLGTTSTGPDPEGDAPRRIAIAPDGRKAVVSNVLSDNVSVVDCSTGTVDTVIPIGDRVQNLAITSDSRWAAICGFESNSVKVLDLLSNELVADVPCGSRTGVIAIGPGDTLAYALNISANTMTVIRLDGAASYPVTTLSCGVIGVVWAGYGILSGVAVSPDVEHVVVCASFDDKLKVFDARANALVADLDVGDFPLKAEFNATGEFAVVTNYFSDNYSVVRIQGDSSYVVGTFPTGEKPSRLARNPVRDEIGIGNYAAKTLVTVNPTNGSVINTQDYASYGALLQVGYDELGEPMVLTMSDGTNPGHLHRGADHVVLPAVPTFFGYSAPGFRAAVAMPGPDWVSIVQWDPSGTAEQRPVLPGITVPKLALSPNPARRRTRLEMSLPGAGPVSLDLFDSSGRLVRNLLNADLRVGSHVFDADLSGVPAGVYVARCRQRGGVATARLVLGD